MTMSWEQFCRILSRSNEVIGTQASPITVSPPTGSSRACRLTQRYWTEPVKIEHVKFDGHVDLSGMVFDSSLQIEHCQFPQGLKLANTRVAGLLSLRGCCFFDVDQPNQPWLDWRSLEVRKVFTCASIKSKVGLCLANARFKDDVRFDASEIQSGLQNEAEASEAAESFSHADEKELTKFLVGCAIHLEGSTIQGGLYFDSADGCQTMIRGALDLRARIGGTIQFCGTSVSLERIQAANGIAINCAAADIGRSVFFWPGEKDGTSKFRFECDGKIDLRGKIGGQVSFNGARISVERIPAANGIAINCEAADIGGSVFFWPGENDGTSKFRFECDGQIDLRGKIGGQVSFDGARISVERIRAAKGIAINCEAADIGGSVFFRPGDVEKFECSGDVRCFAMRCLAVRVSGSIFRGQLDFSYFESENDFVFERFFVSRIEKQFSLEHATIHGNLKIDEGGGQIEIHSLNCAHAVIHGDVELKKVMPLQKGKPEPQESNFFDDWKFDFAKIDGNLKLNGSRIPGNLKLEDAVILGEFNLSEATVDKHLSMRSSTVAGRVFADEDTSEGPYPQVRGKVDLSYSTLNQIDIAIRSSSAANGYIPKEIILTGTKAKTFTVKKESDPDKAGNSPEFIVDGFLTSEVNCKKFGEESEKKFSCRDIVRFCIAGLLVGGTAYFFEVGVLLAIGIGISWAIDFALISALPQPEKNYSQAESDKKLLEWLKTTKFDRGFYLEMEEMARANGDDGLADEIFFTRRRKETERHAISTQEKVWHWLLDFCLGYGVRTARIWILFFLLWGLNTAVFSNPKSVERPLTFVAKMTTEKQTDNTVTDPKDSMRETETAIDQTTQKKPEYVNPWYGSGGKAGTEEWTIMDGGLMAMRIQLPLLPLIAESDWEPASEQMFSGNPGWAWLTYENYASVMIFINLILFPLLIGSATGFLKRIK